VGLSRDSNRLSKFAVPPLLAFTVAFASLVKFWPRFEALSRSGGLLCAAHHPQAEQLQAFFFKQLRIASAAGVQRLWAKCSKLTSLPSV
jgi:hypothetical protein